MCCYEKRNVINECNALFDENGIATFYKVVMICRNRVKVKSIIGCYEWKRGINQIVRDYIEYDVNSPEGLHVYLTKQDAIMLQHSYEILSSARENMYIILKVVCKKEHLIVAGCDSIYYDDVAKQAVFSQVIITQQEWDKHVEPNFSRENQS